MSVQRLNQFFWQWGLTNFDASAFWVRERSQLINALDVTPEFLRTKEGDAGARA